MLHQPVLLKESIKGLAIQSQGIYIDGTFGRGGHSQAILQVLSSEGQLIVIDKDLTAIDEAKRLFSQDKRVKIIHGSFADLISLCQDSHIYGKVNGILLDLGVSSPQLDDTGRGFSFMGEGPLDMRMDTTQALTAQSYIEEASIEEMTSIFRELGEERFAKRIATAIATARATSTINTTAALAEIVKKANPKWEKHKHPATRVFQALRIHINKELEDLKKGLSAALEVLAVGGRLVVISFHSLEDRIVKHFMQLQEKGEAFPKNLPIREKDIRKHFNRVGKAIKPTLEEIENNYRSRSAVLRIGEKLL